MVNAFNSPPRATKEDKDFSKQVDKYTKRLTNFIKKQPKKKLLKVRSRTATVESRGIAPPHITEYTITRLEKMTNDLKSKNFETEKRQRNRVRLAQKRMREEQRQLFNYNSNNETLTREAKRRAKVMQTKWKKQNENLNTRKRKNDLDNEKQIEYKKKFLNMTQKLNDQLHSRLVSRSDKIQNVVLSRNSSDPINLKPFKNGEIILSTGKPGQYFSLNSFEKLLKRQKTQHQNTGVRKVEEIKSLAENNRSKNTIVYKMNPLNRQAIHAKNVKFVRAVIKK